MLRPKTLLRALPAPSRLALAQASVPSITLARHYSTPSEPQSTTTTTTTTTTTATSPPPPPTTTSASPTQPPQKQTAYHVRRTPSNQLAVYHLAKRGGNKKLTSIKKVEGDRARFRAALARDLGVAEKGVVVNNLTGHVIIPGHRKEEVTGWLERQGF
ncbi:mitochondrial large subunit ribosomal protein-domain-containing protein [Parachaetomium inaequale]|uniref:Large ribosomal subunit protein mL49 n=1 Tax=Parachaetomium inaequale TaxID=2588326 RepID=A0AAN6P9K2_9PEZI|nr:mitochondrial large subunit ribosomal protein-domain-containing protein [Parachaetomium inaequale]